MKSRVNLTEGPVFKNLLRFAIPIFLGAIVTQLYHVADSVIVGRFVSADALAAVSASGPVMNIINMCLIGLSSGANVVIAQRAGAKDQTALQNAVSTIACLTAICAILITVVGLLISRPLLTALGTPENIFQDSLSYLIVVYLGTSGNLLYQMGSGALQGMGDSTWPFLFLLLCSILNVVLDLIAVLVLGLGVVGVAIATAISQLVSGIGVLVRLNRGSYGVKVALRMLHVDAVEARKIFGIGLPAVIQNIGNTVAALCVQSSVNVFGSAFIAANSIVVKVEDMINVPIMALSTALCTFVGQNMGVFRLDRIKKGVNASILSLCAVGAVMCVLLITLRNIFPWIFTDDPMVVRYTAQGLLITAFMCLYYGIDRCLVNAMRGAGKAIVPMITAQFGAFSRIPLAYLLAVKTGNYLGIFYAMLIASFLRAAAIAVYYYCGGWKRAVRRMELEHNKWEVSQ